MDPETFESILKRYPPKFFSTVQPALLVVIPKWFPSPEKKAILVALLFLDKGPHSFNVLFYKQSHPILLKNKRKDMEKEKQMIRAAAEKASKDCPAARGKDRRHGEISLDLLRPLETRLSILFSP